MFNRNNNKRTELRSALRSGDPYVVAKVFQISGVAPQKSPCEPQLGGNHKEPLQENGVDFTNVAKLLVEANEYAVHVRRFLSANPSFCLFSVLLWTLLRLVSHRCVSPNLSPCFIILSFCRSLPCRGMPSRATSLKLPFTLPFIKPLDHRREIGWYRPCRPCAKPPIR